MGLDINGTRLLLYAQQLGVSFEATATVGRQGMFLTARALSENLRAFGRDIDERQAEALIAEGGGYCERFLELLGAVEVRSFDASEYEHATDVSDFNLPVSSQNHGRFSAVFDGGSLEHIFNFPTAMHNCMQMVRPGGHFMAISPANNFLGHGFYQFSPELFFRLFVRENGFEAPHVIMYEDAPEAEWFQVTDPNVVSSRVTLVNNQPTYIAVIAKKIGASAQLYIPQQSDYSALWQMPRPGNGTPGPTVAGPARRNVVRRFAGRVYAATPRALKRVIYRSLRDLATQSFSNRAFYTRIPRS